MLSRETGRIRHDHEHTIGSVDRGADRMADALVSRDRGGRNRVIGAVAQVSVAVHHAVAIDIDAVLHRDGERSAGERLVAGPHAVAVVRTPVEVAVNFTYDHGQPGLCDGTGPRMAVHVLCDADRCGLGAQE